MKHMSAFSVAFLLYGLIVYLGEPWLALVAFTGPVTAWFLSVVGVTGAGILTFLTGGGSFPIVAGVGFVTTLVLAVCSFFI